MDDTALARGLVDIIPALRAYAKVLTKSSTLADDLVQDALERAWRGRAMFAPGSSLRAWTFSILRNRFTDDFRQNRRTVQDVDGAQAATLVSPAEQLWFVQYGDMLRAINGMTPHVRDALILVMCAGLSHEEAAVTLDCPLGTLKSRIRRAKDRLAMIVDA